MIEKMLEFFGYRFNADNFWESVHNYIDFEDMTVRKGATPARKGQKIIVPINMRDGSIIAMGRGNEEWLQSAPHGAGRVMSRSQAKRVFPCRITKQHGRYKKALPSLKILWMKRHRHTEILMK